MRQRYLAAVFVALAAAVAALSLQALNSSGAEVRSTTGTRAPVAIDEPSALLLGDGYLLPRREACLPAVAMGWACHVAARRQIGYVADGVAEPPPGTLVDRLPRAYARYLADLVVVDAGRADVRFLAEDVAAAVATYLTQVRATWPEARIVVLEPYRIGSAAPVFSETVLAQLRSTAAEIDAAVVSPVADGWTAPRNSSVLVEATGIRLTERGRAYVNDQLTATLRRLDLEDLPITDIRGSSSGSGLTRRLAGHGTEDGVEPSGVSKLEPRSVRRVGVVAGPEPQAVRPVAADR